MHVSRELWVNWLTERSLVGRYPALLYLIPFLLGSISWRLRQVQWSWYGREIRTLPYGIIFILLMIYILRAVWWRFWMLLRVKSRYLLLMLGILVFGYLYTAYFWERTKIPDYLNTISNAEHQFSYKISEVHILGQVLAIKGEGRDVTWTIRPCVIYADNVAQPLPKLHGKIEVKQLTYADTTINQDFCTFAIGDKVILTGMLREFANATNPGQFDYERYQRYQGFIGQMWQPEVQLYSRPKLSLWRWFQQGKESAARFFTSTLSHGHQPLVMALLTGETDNLAEHTLMQIRNLGLSHLFAISGLHLGFVVTWLKRVLGWIRFPRKWQSFIILSALWLAVLFVGARPSALRVGCYLTLAEVANLFQRPHQPLNLLAVTAWIILLMNPLTLFLVSFQLSFLVYLFILVFAQPLGQGLQVLFPSKPARMQRFFSKLSSAVAVSLAAFFGSLPLVLFHFFQIPLQGIIMNFWAVPLTGVFLVLMIITLIGGLFFPPFGRSIAFFLDRYVGVFQFLLDFFTSRFSNVWQPGRPLLFWIVIFYVLCWLGWWMNQRYKMPQFWKQKKKKMAIYCMLLTLVCFFITCCFPLFDRGIEWVVLDVGQGDSMYWHLPGGKVILVDGGGNPTGDNYIGERILKPFLLSRGIQKIDLICITHFDADHVRGLLPILEEFQIGVIWASEGSKSEYSIQVEEIAKRRGIPIFYPKRGQSIQIGETRFDILHPANGQIYTSENARSIVLRITGQGGSFLLVGDLGMKEEKEIIGEEMLLQADFLKIGHHGSKYSTSSIFLQAVNPIATVISVGKNRYGHPAKETLKQLVEKKCAILRTDELGAIRVYCQNGKTLWWNFNKK